MQLDAFCLDRVFRWPDNPQSNRKAINCKICDQRELSGDAFEVYILDARYFLCPKCADRVSLAKESMNPCTPPTEDSP